MKIFLFILPLTAALLSGCKTSEPDIFNQNRPIFIDCRTDTPRVVTENDKNDLFMPTFISDIPEQPSKKK